VALGPRHEFINNDGSSKVEVTDITLKKLRPGCYRPG